MFDRKEKNRSKSTRVTKDFFGWNIMLIIITFSAILLNFSVFLTFNIRNEIKSGDPLSHHIPYINFDLSGCEDLILISGFKVIVYGVYKNKHKSVIISI